MQKESGVKWKTGLFVILGLVLLVAALFYIGTQKNLFGSVFRLRAVFSNVSGLKVGNNVRMQGIDVGTVENIGLITDTSVLVVMAIQEKVHKFIGADATAGIGSEGLMGDKVVLIIPGTSGAAPVRGEETLSSHPAVETDQILSSLKTSADNAAIITQQLAEISYKINKGHGVISRLIGDTSLSNNLNNTITNLKKGSQGLTENMEAAKHNFLLRGYFRKKQKEEERKKQDEEKKKNDNQSTTQN